MFLVNYLVLRHAYCKRSVRVKYTCLCAPFKCRFLLPIITYKFGIKKVYMGEEHSQLKKKLSTHEHWRQKRNFKTNKKTVI